MEQNYIEIISELERNIEAKKDKLDKKNHTITCITLKADIDKNNHKQELKKQENKFNYIIKDQKETIDRISAKMSRMARQLKRLATK